MKRLIIFFIVIFLFCLPGCVRSPKKFSISIKEGRYIYNNDIVVNDILVKDFTIKFIESNIMKYVKHKNDMVKDLYTIDEKFYGVYDVFISMNINEKLEVLKFTSMKQKSYNDINEYTISNISHSINSSLNEVIIDKINIKLIDEDNDNVSEKIYCEIVYKNDDLKNTIIEMYNNDLKHKLFIIDSEEYIKYPLGNNYFSFEIIQIVTRKYNDKKPILYLNNEVLYPMLSEDKTEWIFKFQMPNKDSDVVIKSE